MSAGKSGADNPVHDGLQNVADPIPKEPAGVPAVDGSSKGSEAPGHTKPGGDDLGVNDPSGPAEEQDDASPDERGLTTELGPSD